jgi:hypothetical protein
MMPGTLPVLAASARNTRALIARETFPVILLKGRVSSSSSWPDGRDRETAASRPPMQIKRHARLKEAGVLSFRKERPWSWQQVSELSLPGLMSDNQQAGHGR